MIGDSSVGSGSRRIEALVGIEAFRALATERALAARLTDLFKTPRDLLEERIAATVEELKVAQRKLAALQTAALAQRIPALIEAARPVGSVLVVADSLGEVDSVEDLRQISLQVRERSGSNTVAAIFGVVNAKPMVVVSVGSEARSAGVSAGALVKVVSGILGGGGGGKDDIAQGGGTDTAAIPAAIQALVGAIA